MCLTQNCALYVIIFTIIHRGPTVYSTNPFPDIVLFLILQGSDYLHLRVRKLIVQEATQVAYRPTLKMVYQSSNPGRSKFKCHYLSGEWCTICLDC